MLELIEQYGKTIHLSICISLVFMILFVSLQYHEQKGILNIAGQESFVDTQNHRENMENAYTAYLEKGGSQAYVKDTLKTNQTYDTGDIFGKDDEVEAVRISDVYDGLTGIRIWENIQNEGQTVSFQKSGLYKIYVWNRNASGVETKQAYYLMVE